jgi:hypothetical protein
MNPRGRPKNQPMKPDMRIPASRQSIPVSLFTLSFRIPREPRNSWNILGVHKSFLGVI